MAFTIRTWSRRTLRQTFFQLMECQPGTRSGAAPASVAAADMSALLPKSVGQGSLVTENQREVCRLSPWGDVAFGLNPYPTHYGPAFACSLLLYPPPRGFALRLTVPAGRLGKRRAYHVPPVSRCGWGRASPPVVRQLRRGSSEPPDLTTYLLVQAIQHLALGLVTTFNSASPELTRPHDPGSQPPGCWESRPWPRDRGRPPERRRLLRL